MTADAFRDGLHRVRSAPAVIVSVFVMTLLLALPAGLVLRETLEAHLGSSLEANAAAEGVNYDWWQEFASQAGGLGSTFSPSIIGFAAALDNTSSVLDAQREILPISMLVAAYLVLWTFLLGGIVDRYARQRPTHAHGFFMAGGVFFFRFLRLGVVAGVTYWLLYRYVHDWLFTDWFTHATRGLNVERSAFIWRLGMYGIFGTLLLLINLLFDYAKIRAVVEDRRSMTGALVAAARFVFRHPTHVGGLYVVNAFLFVIVMAVWALIAPGAGGAGSSIWIGFVLGQLYLLARLFVKLHFIASQTSLFQASLAHARYTAVPAAVWPESPALEAIPTIHIETNPDPVSTAR